MSNLSADFAHGVPNPKSDVQHALHTNAQLQLYVDMAVEMHSGRLTAL